MVDAPLMGVPLLPVVTYPQLQGCPGPAAEPALCGHQQQGRDHRSGDRNGEGRARRHPLHDKSESEAEHREAARAEQGRVQRRGYMRCAVAVMQRHGHDRICDRKRKQHARHRRAQVRCPRPPRQWLPRLLSRGRPSRCRLPDATRPPALRPRSGAPAVHPGRRRQPPRRRRDRATVRSPWRGAASRAREPEMAILPNPRAVWWALTFVGARRGRVQARLQFLGDGH